MNHKQLLEEKMELRKRAFGLSLGLVWGLIILLGTWWLILIGSPGITVQMLGKFFIGYAYSYEGALIGFIWGFVYGFIVGFLVAWFYGMFSKKLYKNKP